MKFAAIYTLLFTLIVSYAGKAQTQGTVSSHGPDKMVRGMLQDKTGNIWLASPAGIFRYDGKVFTNVTGEAVTARFFSVLDDVKGNFWFASIGSGVYYYDGKSLRNYTTRDGLASDVVPHMYRDKSGNTWFGTEKGASRYDGKSFQNYKMNESSPDSNVWAKYDNDVNVVIEDKSGKFWFGTRGKAYTYDGKMFTLLKHDGTRFWNVRKIIEDKKGNIWLGGDDGLWRYDGNTFTNFTADFVGYICEDKTGNIWITSRRASDEKWVLSRYDEKSLHDSSPVAKEIYSQPGMLLSILEDDKGNIWFGSGDGVYTYDGKTVMKL